jgi:hypothetical protein
VRTAAVVFVALWAAGTAAAGVVPLPSPTTRIGSEPPLGSATPTGPVQLPRPPRVDSRQLVLVGVAESGELATIRVRHRLTLNGRGDYFFQVPAPVRDVRALPESQSEPGLRRSAIVWQGFSPGRRVLAAELELEPGVVARTLPLRIERNDGAITLRNTTSVEVEGFTGKVERSSMRRLLARLSARSPAAAPAVQVAGQTRRRRLRAEAPLRIRGTIEREGRVLRRVGLILGGPEPAEATISAPAGARVALTAEPVPLISDLTRPPRDAGGEELLVLAEQALLRVARVNQYRSFLASPGSGTAAAVYRFRTVDPPAALPTPADDDESNLLLVLGLGAGAVFALAGAVVVWAHL